MDKDFSWKLCPHSLQHATVMKAINWRPDLVAQDRSQNYKLIILRTTPAKNFPNVILERAIKSLFENPTFDVYFAVPSNLVSMYRPICNTSGIGLIEIASNCSKIVKETIERKPIIRSKKQKKTQKPKKIDKPKVLVCFLSSKQHATERAVAKRKIKELENLFDILIEVVTIEHRTGVSPNNILKTKKDIRNAIIKCDICLCILTPKYGKLVGYELTYALNYHPNKLCVLVKDVEPRKRDKEVNDLIKMLDKKYNRKYIPYRTIRNIGIDNFECKLYVALGEHLHKHGCYKRPRIN